MFYQPTSWGYSSAGRVYVVCTCGLVALLLARRPAQYDPSTAPVRAMIKPLGNRRLMRTRRTRGTCFHCQVLALSGAARPCMATLPVTDPTLSLLSWTSSGQEGSVSACHDKLSWPRRIKVFAASCCQAMILLAFLLSRPSSRLPGVLLRGSRQTAEWCLFPFQRVFDTSQLFIGWFI